MDLDADNGVYEPSETNTNTHLECYTSGIDTSNIDKNNARKRISFTLKKKPESIASVVSSVGINTPECQNRSGFYYRLPVFCNLIISNGDKKEKPVEVTIPQFGFVTSLPVNLKNVKITFHAGTGALKSIAGESAILQLADVEAAGKSLVGVSESLEKKDKRDKQIEDLEKDVKIKELQDKLNGKPAE